MNKRFNLMILVMCIVEVICCFTPYCLNEEYWTYDPLMSLTYHGVSTLKSEHGVSIFENRDSFAKMLAVLFVCSAIAVAVTYYLDMNSAMIIIGKPWISAVVHTVAMIVFLLYACLIAQADFTEFRLEYGVNWMSYIIIALNLVSLVLAITS